MLFADEDSFPEISELRDSLDALSDDTTQCCVYCPNLRLDNLLLFKVVSSLNTASVGIMMQSARDQIQGLAKFLSSSQSSKNLQAKFNFIVIWKVPKNSNVEQYSDEIKASVGKIERELVSKFGKVSLTVTEVSMDKKESKFDEAEITKVKNLVNIDSANGFESSQNETLLAQLILKASEKPTLCFTETEFNLHGSNENVKVDEKGMVTFMNFYFPSKTQKLITIPDIDHCKLNQLQYLNENSELISDPNLNVYKGELQLFWPELHKWFNDKPYGLLLHGLKNDILSRVMKRKFPFVFEIDWLLSTEDYLIAFEVGLKTSENPKSIIRNKLNQIFTKIIPTLKLLTWFALVNYDNQAEKKINFILKNLDSFFYKHFRAVVFIGNVESEELKKNLHEMLLAPSNETGLEFESEDLSEDSLRAVYFAGAPKNDDNHFLQIRRESTLEKLVVVETEVKKVVELLKPLDVKTMESVEASSQSIANENTRNILNYVLAAYTLCFFVDEDGSCKLKPAQTEVKDIDVRFSVAPKKQKIEKNETKPNRNKTENILEISRKLTVLVSRQQLSILREDPKFLIIRGEPGSGKTVLLLAKAKQAAMSPDVHKIYFYIPSPKLKLKSFVMEFVEKHSEDKRFTERFEILDDENLNQILRSKNRKDLKKTVLLMDEFYFGTDKSLENREREIFGLSIEIFPYLKNCWIACVALCFFGKFTQFLPNYLPIEMFCIKPLNIQFRASEHIAKFCTNIVHKGEIKGFSSCRVPGVYTSSQVKIEPKVFKDKNDINFGSLQEKFIKRRWAVVYCDPEKKRQWLEFLKRDAKFHDFEEKFVVSITEGPAHCDFSGGECFSLVLIIDKIDTPDTDRDKLMEEAIYTLAMSRAQYEIEIFVHESMKLLIEQWGKYCVMDTVEKPGIAREIYLASLGDDKKAKCNYKRLTKTHLTNLGQFVNGDQKKFVLVFLGRGLAIRILNFLLALSSRVQNQQNDDDFYQKKEYHDAIKGKILNCFHEKVSFIKVHM